MGEELLSEFDFLSWCANVRPFPLPPHMTPVSGAPLRTVSDEHLLTAPPHLLTHLQRTAAQGGLQVISPRQIPFSQLMLRVPGGRREVGDHVVGSIAEPDAVWPTIDDADFSDLLPDEPLPPVHSDVHHRAKTKTVGLAQSTQEMVDPIVACLVKGRAVVDVLRRDDVQGGADEYVKILGSAWGIEAEDIEDLEAYTLGVDGPLLRHAIKVDDVYPTMYAPCHVRHSISVGASESNRSYLPPDTAIDWRRMRVHAEAVFAMTCMVEGHPIPKMMCIPPPGDPGAPSNRPNVLCFQPAPASAWTFSPDSFSVVPIVPQRAVTACAVPREVLEALARHVQLSRPASYALSQGHALKMRRTTTQPVAEPVGETLTGGFRFVMSNIALGTSRGRTAMAAVRNTIYEAFEAADMHTRLRLARYLDIAMVECKEHLSLPEVPDRMIEKLACRFLKIGDTIRVKIVGEAARRGSSADEWWQDLLSQAPGRYRQYNEGTRGWAVVGMWLLFKGPTEKWRKLAQAVKYQSLRAGEVNALGSMNLPPEKGSPERLLVAAKCAIKRIANAYGGYYKGVSDVAVALSETAEEMGRTRTALMLREAACLWVLRARCFRGTNVEVLKEGELPSSENHLYVRAKPMSLSLVPAPYKAFEAYQAHVGTSTMLRNAYKAYIAKSSEVRISDVFAKWKEPLIPAKATTVTRYVVTPWALANDMEAAWHMMRDDLAVVASIYGVAENLPPVPVVPPVVMKAQALPLLKVEAPTEGLAYWTLMSMIDEDERDHIESLYNILGPDTELDYENRTFKDIDELVVELQIRAADVEVVEARRNDEGVR